MGQPRLPPLQTFPAGRFQGDGPVRQMQMSGFFQRDIGPGQPLDFISGQPLLPGQTENEFLRCVPAGLQQTLHGFRIHFFNGVFLHRVLLFPCVGRDR